MYKIICDECTHKNICKYRCDMVELHRKVEELNPHSVLPNFKIKLECSSYTQETPTKRFMPKSSL